MLSTLLIRSANCFHIPLEEVSVLKRNQLLLEKVMLKRARNIISSQKHIEQMKKLPNNDDWNLRKKYVNELSPENIMES